MQKVIALHTSKRKMNTYRLLVQIQQELAQKEIEVEILSLYDYSIQDCFGCEKCIKQDECLHHDPMEALMSKMAAADGIILSTPVYLKQVSGKLKCLIDRTCKWYHRPVLYGKPILCVSTTKGSGLKSTLSYLRSVAVQWGAIPVGQIGRTIRSINSPVSAKELSGFIKLLQEPQSYHPPFRVLIDFEIQKALAKYLGGLDADYWKEKGWETKPYYIPCRPNLLQCFIARIFGSVLQRGMARGKKKTV